MFESRDPAAPETSAPRDENGLTQTVSYVTLAQILKVTQDTVQRWVKSGKIIQPAWFGDMARWTIEQARQILAEGTQPAGTYPPTNRRHQADAKAVPQTITAALGHQVKTHGPTGRKKPAAKKPAAKKRRAK
jgi:hypothetical protein